jgi:hypothetical protein
MFKDLVKRLVHAGLTEDQASGKLLHAAETWRKAP